MAKLPKYWTEQTALNYIVERHNKQPKASGGYVANNYNATCRCAIGQLASRKELRNSIWTRRALNRWNTETLKTERYLKRGHTQIAGYEGALMYENPSYAERCKKLHPKFLSDLRHNYDSIFIHDDQNATGKRKDELTETFRSNIQFLIDSGAYKQV